jgi:hypothetical protein
MYLRVWCLGWLRTSHEMPACSCRWSMEIWRIWSTSSFFLVCQNKFRVLDTFFGFRVEGLHSSKICGLVAYSHGGHAIDSHFRQKGGEIFCLDVCALLYCEACGAKGVLYHLCSRPSESVLLCLNKSLSFNGLSTLLGESCLWQMSMAEQLQQQHKQSWSKHVHLRIE